MTVTKFGAWGLTIVFLALLWLNEPGMLAILVISSFLTSCLYD